MKLLLIMVILAVAGTEAAKEKAIKVKDKDMMRKMIIYDKVTTLTVTSDSMYSRFYCPLEKSKHLLLPSAWQVH